MVHSGLARARRNPRAVIAAAMLALAIAIGAALMFGSSASASCRNTGYGIVCTKPKPYIKVKPTKARRGGTVTAYGWTGNGCPAHSTVAIYSSAFKGSGRPGPGNVPAFFTKTNKQHKFSRKVTVGKSVTPKSYIVSGRCGGGRFASTHLSVG